MIFHDFLGYPAFQPFLGFNHRQIFFVFLIPIYIPEKQLKNRIIVIILKTLENILGYTFVILVYALENWIICENTDSYTR